MDCSPDLWTIPHKSRKAGGESGFCWLSDAGRSAPPQGSLALLDRWGPLSFLSCAGGRSPGEHIADMPHWMGGLPADAPPRRKTIADFTRVVEETKIFVIPSSANLHLAIDQSRQP